jgi:hypothetical protein
MKKQILEELKDIKYLFNYSRGKVISEQEQFESEDADLEDNLNMFMGDDGEEDDDDINYLKGQFDEELDEDLIENRELEVPVKPGTKTPTKPKKPGTPYSPKPGPKKNPKARKGDMPDWLSFDELGIDFE